MKKITDEVTSIRLMQAKDACRVCMATEALEKVRITPLLLGPPGQGKTSIIDQLVDDLNMERFVKYKGLLDTGKTEVEANELAGAEWVQISYRLAQCDPTDLKGVPVYEVVDGVEMCSFAPPKIFPMVGLPNSAGGKNVVIFLDELPQANPTIQNLAANIIDGKVGDHTIDMSRSFIICAGNRRQDHAATYEIPRNVGGRLIKFDIKTGFDEWQDWAIQNGVHSLVIGYLKEHTTFFNEAPPENSYTYGTPRTWEKVSCLLKQMGDEFFSENSLGLYIIQGTVGQSSATTFHQFAKAARQQFSVDDIMAGKSVKIPTDDQKDILFSLVLESTYRINSWMEEVSHNPKFKTERDMKVRSDLVVKSLGKDRVSMINNIYTWLDNKGIDPAFQVLINKYQSQKTKDLLRMPLSSHSDFSKAAPAYENIHRKLLSIKS